MSRRLERKEGAIGMYTCYLLAHGVETAMEVAGDSAGPEEKGSPVALALEVGHETVEDVGLGGQDVDGIHGRVHLATVLDALDIWARFSGCRAGSGGPGLLAMLWLRMSSSRTALSRIFLVNSSSTKTFHYVGQA